MSMQHDCPENKHNDQLVFDSKQAAWIVSALLLLLFFVFMGGYFLGKHYALEQFSHALDQESISDKIYCSVYAAYEGKTGIGPIETDKIHNNTIAVDISPEQGEQQIPRLVQSPTYYAPLIGFGSLKVAQAYVDRLIAKGFPVLLKQRTSKTAKGREIQWYQVVTKAFSSRTELESLIALLEKQERLNPVTIITV